jgi:hypothetical protein
MDCSYCKYCTTASWLACWLAFGLYIGLVTGLVYLNGLVSICLVSFSVPLAVGPALRHWGVSSISHSREISSDSCIPLATCISIWTLPLNLFALPIHTSGNLGQLTEIEFLAIASPYLLESRNRFLFNLWVAA